MTAVIAQHSSVSNEHYTPLEIVDAARLVMGGIDLDPATTALVNDRVIGATSYYTKETNGFAQFWHGRTFLNPPGGKVGNKSNAALWWSKLVDEYAGLRVTQAIFVGFTLEILATSQDAAAWIGDFPFVIPRRRLAFNTEDEEGKLVTGESPPHSNVIAYLPDSFLSVSRFVKVFEKFGQVVVPQQWASE